MGILDACMFCANPLVDWQPTLQNNGLSSSFLSNKGNGVMFPFWVCDLRLKNSSSSVGKSYTRNNWNHGHLHDFTSLKNMLDKAQCNLCYACAVCEPKIPSTIFASHIVLNAILPDISCNRFVKPISALFYFFMSWSEFFKAHEFLLFFYVLWTLLRFRAVFLSNISICCFFVLVPEDFLAVYDHACLCCHAGDAPRICQACATVVTQSVI